MVDEKALYVQAKRSNIKETKAYKEQLENAEKQLLVSLFIKDNVEKNVKVTDEDVQSYYNNNPDQFKAVEQRHVRHILVKTEKDAQEIHKEIKKGADFNEVAKKRSLDTTAANGGDLGWIIRGQLVPDFEKEAFRLAKKEISGVVQTQFGYHIIKLEDITTRPKSEFKDVKTQIYNLLYVQKQRDELNKYLTSAKEKMKITREIAKIQ